MDGKMDRAGPKKRRPGWNFQPVNPLQPGPPDPPI